jgi:hypothetical protein
MDGLPTTNDVKPILVTGAPRSGTTWLGKMLSRASELQYIHEPFNPDHPPSRGVCRRPFDRYSLYICEDNEDRYRRQIDDIFSGRFSLTRALARARSAKEVGSAVRHWKTFKQHRRAGGVPLVKDPIALLSAPWLANHLDIRCVVVVRHPAAVVSSLKRLNWMPHPERWALGQPHLMRDYLERFREEINQVLAEEGDLIDRAALVWKLHHYVIREYQNQFPDWIFLRHEDVSRNPIAEFERLYAQLGLNFTPEIRAYIEDHTRAENPGQAMGTHRTIKLDSAANVSSWMSRLNDSEVARIRNIVEDVSRYFYTDAEWNESFDEGRPAVECSR